MTTNEMWQAMAELDDPWKACLRSTGDYKSWFVDLGRVEIGNGGTLTGVCGFSQTPDGAIRKAWDELTKLKPNEYVVVRAYTDKRKELRWTGYMWKELQREPTHD